ncbi:hypothetical protein EVAR_62434_1 [Eumeta japonica]|uniref:Uncharacterized protein n=1 Tax=Eumeta variegata TaxID=151549 RepID=A0A4C1Z6V5_EUMVA|nr:hypothetical protein EVAR_62434_1 [Eumeta japonica]
MEKYRLNKENLYFLFIDTEKALDRVSKKLIWQAMSAENVPQYYKVFVQDEPQEPHRSKQVVLRSSRSPSRIGLESAIFNLPIDYIMIEGIPRINKVRNEFVKGSFKVAPIAENLKESPLGWYGHILRCEHSDLVNKAFITLTYYDVENDHPPGNLAMTL